ncbi:GGDEF domain-containing protein [Sphingomonas sp. ASV193]|uniref:GGDEF domain-containing protein n=1 Tax=Sphingomonas sp. ASV193 TaxID=3144405 RepID=UPI0032E8780C
MHDVALEDRAPGALLEEIAALKAEVAALRQRVGELDALACQDVLVPAANRRGMMRELDKLIARHARFGEPAAVLFVDLDGLKQVNDRYGHSGGDAALVHVCEQLRDGTRATDTVARLGGDEFCVLLDHADQATAMATAERLIEAIAGDDFLFEGKPMPLSVAIGATMIEPGDTPQSVLARADQAMYRVKSAA